MADIKKDNGKKPAKIVKTSRVSFSEEEGLNFVKGRIENKDIQLLLDTGAQICVMPEEMVPDAAKTGGLVKVKEHSGLVRVRDVAEIDLVVGDLKLHEKVALASTAEQAF